jgi:hypothetical protein
MLRCPRSEFLLLAQGILLERGPDRKVYVGDTPEARAALEAHDRGETVALTAGRYGRVVSYVCNGVETYENQKGGDDWET